jgi:uncharacterized membrane protein YfcA
VAQLLGNLSRAGFGRNDIAWRPVLLFCIGAIPLSVLGASLFAPVPATLLTRGIGVVLLLLVAFRHTQLGKRRLPPAALAPAGALVGFLSAIAGSAGPLGAAVFLSLGLAPTAYVASEAVTAVAMHIAKTVVYGRYALLDLQSVGAGLALGGAMILGSWTGRLLIQRLPTAAFGAAVELLLILSGVLLIVT